MTHDEKVNWMAVWCARNGLKLELQGECGFGRECVGVLSETTYPDYRWHDDEGNRQDNNGKVFIPPNAYHKHECVAVLGRGEEAESQLYDWLRWFDANGFVLETGKQKVQPGTAGVIELLMGRHTYHRLVKKEKPCE